MRVRYFLFGIISVFLFSVSLKGDGPVAVYIITNINLCAAWLSPGSVFYLKQLEYEKEGLSKPEVVEAILSRNCITAWMTTVQTLP
jgi:hypothetical protein